MLYARTACCSTAEARYALAMGGKKKNDEAKEGVANSKKASNKNHSVSNIVIIKDTQKRGRKGRLFHKGIHIKLQVNSLT